MDDAQVLLFYQIYVPPILAIVLMLSAVALAIQYSFSPRTLSKEDVLNMWLSGDERVVMHIHVTLEIYVDGRKLTIPANIGIDPNKGMRVIHTYDETGVIHVMSPIFAEFTLGDFMKIWGKRLDSQCFDTYCGSVRITVNGKPAPDPSSIILNDMDKIVVEVVTK